MMSVDDFVGSIFRISINDFTEAWERDLLSKVVEDLKL